MIKFKNIIVKVLIVSCFVVLLGLLLEPMTAMAFGSTESLTITFRDGYEESQGYVEYSLNDGVTWIKVTSNINNQSVALSSDNLRIRIVQENGYNVDFAGMSYRENNGSPLMLSDNANSSIVGGLISENGYLASGSATSVSLEMVEFSNNSFGDEHGGESHFDGKAYVVWSCSRGICYHYFDSIPAFDDGNSTFYKDSEISDDLDNSIKFDVNADKKFFSEKDRFENWQEEYKSNNNVTTIDWSSIDINDLIGPDGVDFQPVGEPYDNNAYVSYGDRNFKIVIYNDDYKGVTIGNLSNLNYYPASWANPFIRVDQYDISGSTKSNPTVIKTVLLENTINIKALNYNSFVIESMEALDVPSNAVSVTKVNEEFRIIFRSNYYDNVVFKVVDSNSDVSYLKISRLVIDGKIKHINNSPVISADLYFDKNKSYTDFIVSAKIVYKDGKNKSIVMNPVYGVDDGLGNVTDTYEFNEETDDLGGNRGKGLKRSTFNYSLSRGEEDTISKVYINVENKGSTSASYAGAFAGSGKGIVIDFEERS